jgi:hypothetical protein
LGRGKYGNNVRDGSGITVLAHSPPRAVGSYLYLHGLDPDQRWCGHRFCNCSSATWKTIKRRQLLDRGKGWEWKGAAQAYNHTWKRELNCKRGIPHHPCFPFVWEIKQ